MPYYKKLCGDKCYLSPCQPSDAQKWAEWFNDLEVTLPLGDEAYTPYGLEKLEQEVREIIAQREHIFTIVDQETDQPVGRCLLFAIDRTNRSAMLGIVIGEKSYWNRGYGQESLRLLLDYAFNLLNLNSVMLGVFAFNTRGVRCYEKLGFKEIGRRRAARIIAGRAYDVVLMDVLADEFRSLHGPGQIEKIMEGMNAS